MNEMDYLINKNVQNQQATQIENILRLMEQSGITAEQIVMAVAAKPLAPSIHQEVQDVKRGMDKGFTTSATEGTGDETEDNERIEGVEDKQPSKPKAKGLHGISKR